MVDNYSIGDIFIDKFDGGVFVVLDKHWHHVNIWIIAGALRGYYTTRTERLNDEHVKIGHLAPEQVQELIYNRQKEIEHETWLKNLKPTFFVTPMHYNA